MINSKKLAVTNEFEIRVQSGQYWEDALIIVADMFHTTLESVEDAFAEIRGLSVEEFSSEFAEYYA